MNDKKHTIGTFFHVGIILYVSFVIFSAIPLCETIFGRIFVWLTLLSSSSIFILIWLLHSKHTITNTFITIVILLISSYYLLAFHYKAFLPAFCLMCSLRANIQFDKVLRLLCKYTLTFSLVVFIFFLFGILEDHIIYRDNIYIGDLELEAHSLGFYYYSTPAFIFMNLIICNLFLHRKTCSLIRLVVLFFCALLTFMLFVTRLQLYANLLIFVLYILTYKVKIVTFNSPIYKYVGMALFPFLLCSIYIIFSTEIAKDSDYYLILDVLTNGRMSLNVNAFEKYPVGYLGNQIEVSEGGLFEEYFYIDSGYVNCLVRFGIFVSLFFIYSNIKIFRKISIFKEPFLFIWMMLFVVLDTLNNFLISPTCFPLILLTFYQDKASTNCPKLIFNNKKNI